MINIKNKVLEEINEIISIFNLITNADAVSTFSEGYCPYFTIIMLELFKYKNPKIYIQTKNEIHSIIKIDDKYYDVNGLFNYNNNYYEASKEEFYYFIDICNIGKSKENIHYMENICNFIIEKCKKNDKKMKKYLTL